LSYLEYIVDMTATVANYFPSLNGHERTMITICEHIHMGTLAVLGRLTLDPCCQLSVC